MAHGETAWLRIHDLSLVPAIADAFRKHTGYTSNGASLNAWWFQCQELRCSLHPTFQENKHEINTILDIMKKENRGGRREGAGRPATGRQRSNFHTTLGSGTIEYLESIHPNAGKLIDILVSEYQASGREDLFCHKDDTFE